MPTAITELIEVTKHYPGVTALDRVSFDVKPGEVHGLAGENGAGKSTLIKIMSGAAALDAGEIRLDGKMVTFRHPIQAIHAGISVVHQELAATPHLSVTENVLLGQLPRRWGVVRWSEAHRRAREVLAGLNIQLDERQRLADLSLGQQQLIEVARALQRDVRVLILDEPTAILGTQDIDTLFATVRTLRERGVGVVYISHRLDEHFELADRISVLKDGRHVGTYGKAELDRDRLVQLMTGREIGAERLGRQADSGEAPLLAVKGLTRTGVFEDVNFDLHPGEVVGLAGLVGAGRTEVARAIAGLDAADQGEIVVNATPITLGNSRQAWHLGIDLLPENRKEQGLMMNRSITENVTIASLARHARGGVLQVGEERNHVGELVRRVDLRFSHLGQEAGTLSGGNQQKVLLARSLAARSSVLLFDEPTRGVDVGGKREIWHLIREMAEDGAAVLVISSEIEEILSISDRVLVMREGKMVASLEGDDATEDAISRAALVSTVTHEAEEQHGT